MRCCSPLVVALALACPQPARGQCETQRLASPYAGAWDAFGSGLDVDGDTAVVGGYEGTERRVVHVLERIGTQWVRTAELSTSKKAFVSNHLTVAIDRGTVMAWLWSQGAGQVHVFERTVAGWQLTQVLEPSQKFKDAAFGSRIALQGDRAVISAPAESDGAQYSGAVYAFERVAGQWVETQRLVLARPRNYGLFGWDLALDGDRLAVGRPSGLDTGQGAVYVYRRAGGAWKLEQRIDGPASTKFGSSVDLEGDRLVVGDPLQVEAGQLWPGVVIAYRRQGADWIEDDRIVPMASDRAGFGGEVELHGDWLAVGTLEPHLYLDADLVHVFERHGNDWVQRRRLDPYADQVGWTYNWFGSILAMQGNHLLVGAMYDDEVANYSGAVFTYVLETRAEPYCGPAPLNSTGHSGALHAEGCPTLPENDLALVARGLPPGQPGMLLVGTGEAFVPFVGGSQGHLCLGGELGRFRDSVAESDAAGGLRFLVDATDLPLAAGAVAPGEALRFQCWYRDHNPGPTSNLTEAVAVTYQ